MNAIVVGVDGSPGSVDALKFALEEARVRSAAVKAVAAWHIPPGAYGNGFAATPISPAMFEANAKAGLEKALAQAGTASSGVAVESTVREGQAADVLLEAARGAELLVVGSRGRGGFAGLLLGSVGQQCAHHAVCPVAIVPDSHREP